MLNAPLRSFVASFIVATAFFANTSTWAADRRLCEAYVQEAMKEAQRVRDNKCGFDFNNPQWSLNPDVHRLWCLGAKVETVDKERENRRSTSGTCDYCRYYANTAVQSVMAALNNNCTGLDGPRWSYDEQVHFNWCMGLKDIFHRDMFGGIEKDGKGWQNVGALMDEDKQRKALLGDCLLNKGGQPLVAEPSPPNPRTKASDRDKSTALQRPGPRTSSTVDAARQDTQVPTRKSNVKTKKPKEARLQAERPCKPADRRPCPARSKATAGASTSSAMDRLGGGGTPSTSSGGGGGGSSAARSSSAGGGASSATPSGALSGPTGASTTRSSPGPAPGLGLR